MEFESIRRNKGFRMVRTVISQGSRRHVTAIALVAAGACVLAACASEGAPQLDEEVATPAGSAQEANEENPEPEEESSAEAGDELSQEETCEWDSPRISGAAEPTEAQAGELAEVLVGAWQHTHTDEGSGFDEVTNDHRFVFPAPDRMLYCQNVPGATENKENATDVVLNDTRIEWGGGEYGYTVLAWDADTMVWENPVGGGYLYLLQRR